MQKMSADQQTPAYYPNQVPPPPPPHQPQGQTPYYIAQNGIETQYTGQMRPQTIFQPRMNGPPQQMYTNQPMGNGYQQFFYTSSPFLPPAPFVSGGPTTRAMSPQFIPLQRPTNESLNQQMNFVIPQGYSNYPPNIAPGSMYPTAYYPTPYQVQSTTYAPAPPPTQIPNTSAMPPQAPYGLMPGLGQPAGTAPPSVVPTNVTTMLSQNLTTHPNDPSHLVTNQPRSTKGRERKPLAILDPVSHQPVDIENVTTNDHRSHESSASVEHVDEKNKNQIQNDFRQGVAKQLVNDTMKSSTNEEKLVEQTTNEPVMATTTTIATTEVEHEREDEDEEEKEKEKEITEKNIVEEKSDDVNESSSIEVDSNPTTTTTTTTVTKPSPLVLHKESIECVTAPQTPTVPMTKSETKPSSNQRLRYDRDELIRIRDSSTTLSIPQNLPDLDIIIRRDNQRLSYPNYTGTNSHGRFNNPPFNRQISSSSNHPSLSRYPNASNSSSQDPRRNAKQTIYISNEPDFAHRVEKPYKPVDQAKIDANSKFLRDVKGILNKVTPQTYDKLQKQLESLQIDRYERLEGMINIFFSKAVDEPAFSFLYAKLCKQFQKKQVLVQTEDGKTVTHFFRQILLTRCQKEFESDYRQEIEYEKRKKDVESIADEKKKKEEQEKLEEDLVKAKRRKLGNIFFIGELFKLQMLTDTIMYDCIEYLLRDKTDEEALECLCRLLRTIGKELDVKAGEKMVNKNNLEKHYRELDQIVKEHKTSARIRFMIQDLVELRQASWIARRAEAKPMTIDEIHEEERQKRAQQERDAERERQQRREQNRGTVVIGNAYNTTNNPQQYNDGRGSRGSGIKSIANRNDEDRVENRFNVNSLRQLQSNDKRNQGPIAMSLAPQRTWAKGSGIEKKPEDEQNYPRTGKPPAGPVQQLKGKSGSGQGPSAYTLQRQSSRELARENSQRDRENALQSLRRTTNASGGSGVNSPIHTVGTSSMSNSREGSRNVSREQSRNASRESSVSERTSNASLTGRTSKTSALDSSTIINPDPSETSFDEEKIQARVHSLIEEYTENYSENSDRPVKEALEDLVAFRTSNIDQQATIVRELFTNVLEAKPRARKAVGHLLDAAVNDEILSTDAFLSGFKLVVEYAPDYAVDIPLIWQYIGEILGAFIGAPSTNMYLLKPLLENLPNEKTKQMFEYMIRFATEFSSQSHLQKLWQLSTLSFQDLIQSGLIDSSIEEEYQWLTEGADPTLISQSKETFSPRADPQLVKLFKTFNDQNTPVSDTEILNYIQEHMDPKEKFYIRNIVLSYLEACLINREPQKKIQEDIAKKRMTVLNSIIQHQQEAEIQAVYAIQNFVSKLEHPPKMARLLFDIFYDEECVSEDAFFDWLKHPDQSETEGHSVVEMSTKDFFTWLQQAETEVEEGEEETN